ncbi:hypothetical protein ACYULU_15500 [Breznakiellaceae bacterium SP9]
MGENFEVGFYEFIRNELGGLETRIDRRFSEMEARTDLRLAEMDKRSDLRLAEMEARTDLRFAEMDKRSDLRFAEMDKRFDKLEEEVRWPRRIAIGSAITTVLAVIAAIFGFKS